MSPSCPKHPAVESSACARCGAAACASCGTFRYEDLELCAACGEAELRGSGLPLGPVLIAVSYLALVAVLALTRQLRPALLGASALLAIGLARLFSTLGPLRRPALSREVPTTQPPLGPRAAAGPAAPETEAPRVAEEPAPARSEPS